MRYSSSLPIIKRHLYSTIPYINFNKMINVILVNIEQMLGKIILKSKPYFIKIEPTNRCNLKCNGCIHASDTRYLEYEGCLGNMDFEIFKKIIDELRKYLLKVSLYYAGEPLIHPMCVDMVRYLTERNIGSVISSNMNYLSNKIAHDLVKNKLTHLIVSLDGASEETYQKYRKGGSFNKVIQNIKMIQEEKKRQSSRYPIIEVQTIKFSYITNEEINKIKCLTKELGVKIFTLKENVTTHYKNPQSQQKRCFWLYSSLVICWNGIVQPCCFFYEYENNNFGDITKESISAIWNNKYYREARTYFKTGKKGNENIKCYSCIFFR